MALLVRHFAANPSDPTESLSSQYLPSVLTFIAWGAPRIVYPGIDVDFEMIGYDHFRRTRIWSIDSGPGWLSIGSTNGRLTGSPPTDATDHVITVRMTPGSGTPVTLTFTMQVNSAKCLSVSTTGNDSNDGTLDEPYRNIEKALDVAAATPSSGWTIYVRTGTYTEAWAGNVARWGQDFTLTNPGMLRRYPGESFTINNVVKGFGTYQRYFIFYGFEIVGGSESENSCCGGSRKQIVHSVTAHGYHTDNVDNNPAGILTAYDAIAYKCKAYDNNSPSDLVSQNNSNFLHYCDKENDGSESFIIDCIADGGSINGFKLKHSGDDRVFYMGNVSKGSPNGFLLASDWCSVLGSLVVGDVSFGVGNRSCISNGGSSEGNGSIGHTQGILVDGNLFIGETDMTCLDMGYDQYITPRTASNCPVYRDNTIVTVETTTVGGGNYFNWPLRRYNYDGIAMPSPGVRKVIDNVIYSSSSSLVQWDHTNVETTRTISQLNSQPECSGNTHAGAIGSTTLTKQAAGYNWSYTAAGGLVQGSAL